LLVDWIADLFIFSGKVIDVLITLLRSMGAQSPVEEVIWNSPPPVLWLLGGRLHEHMAFSGTQKEKKEQKRRRGTMVNL
jgi:hypothetical protein